MNKFSELSRFKPYWEMNRGERREYKRWLLKNEMWDGAIVVENQVKSSKLLLKDI